MPIPPARLSLLPSHVQAQIKSTIDLTSLNQVVEELLKNSLDASANTVEISVDYQRGFCSVKDNGEGIPPAEFDQDGGLAKPYYTSKYDRTIPSYSAKGIFLYRLSSISLLSISSRHTSSQDIGQIKFHQGEQIFTKSDDENDWSQFESHGTEVTVHNLFANIPVRSKICRNRYITKVEVEKDFRDLQRTVASFILAQPCSIALRLSNASNKQKLLFRPTLDNDISDRTFSLERITSVFRQTGLSTKASSWQQVSARTEELFIRAAISLDSFPTKHHQFISIGIYPIAIQGFHSSFYDIINESFGMSIFGNEKEPIKAENIHELGYSTRSEKILDRWPAFYIRIDYRTSRAYLHSERHFGETFPSPETVKGLLEAVIHQFRLTHRLKPRKSRRKDQNVRQSGNRSTNITAVDGADLGCIKLKSMLPTTHLDWSWGLPFTTESSSQFSLSVGSQGAQDVQQVYPCIDDSIAAKRDPTSQELSNSLYINLADEAPAMNESVEWINPITGRSLLLNPQNGFAFRKMDMHNEFQTLRIIDGFPDTTGADSSSKPPFDYEIEKRYVSTAYHQKEPAIPSLLHFSYQKSISSDPIANSAEEVLNLTSIGLAKIIGQVAEKFILTLMTTTSDSEVLVLVDQHAADERIKVEKLYKELCDGAKTVLEVPIIFEITNDEAELLQRYQRFFAAWSIEFDIGSSNAGHPSTNMTVNTLPTAIAERCRHKPKLLIEILRREIWSSQNLWSEIRPDEHWFSRITHCPTGLLDAIHSRACRSAIMFNDVLNYEQCSGLLTSLSQCRLPFQCAHGRPSMVVVGGFATGHTCSWNLYDVQDQNSFGHAYTAWKLK